MAKYDEEGAAALTEPVTVQDVFVTGAAVESTEHVLRVVGWVALPYLSGDETERRIVVRFVMPIDGARTFSRGMREHLSRRDGKQRHGDT